MFLKCQDTNRDITRPVSGQSVGTQIKIITKY